MKTVPLSGPAAAGLVALVDDGDYALVSQHRWFIKRDTRPGRDAGPYARANIRTTDGRKTTIGMHTLITGWPRVDHGNHDGLDNRRANLRPATRPQNAANARPQQGRSSRFKGVCWDRRTGRWQAKLAANYRSVFLGRFSDEAEAARAYDAAALRVWGEFACLNFPAGRTQ